MPLASKRRLCRCAFFGIFEVIELLFKHKCGGKEHHFRTSNNIVMGNDLKIRDIDVNDTQEKKQHVCPVYKSQSRSNIGNLPSRLPN